MTRHRTGFWNRIARKYARRPVADEAAYQTKLDKTAAFMSPDMQVLEFGCGTGTTALKHAHRVARIDAIDFSDAMIAIARDKGQAQGADNVRFAVSAIEDWPIPPDRYDMVMAHSVLHLVEDLDATLARVRTMLKPGGILVQSTACIGDVSPILSWVLPLGGMLRIIPRVQALTSDGLRKRANAAGFTEIEYWKPSADKPAFIISRALP